MAYIGNTQQNQNYVPAIDYFSGNGSTTAFTLSRPVASVAQVQAVIENVPQNPGDAYTVSGNTITFTSAPSSGTNNIYIYYTSPNTQVVQPGQGTVSPSSLSTGGPYWDTSGNVGIGTSSPNEALTLQRGSGASAAITLQGNGNTSTNEVVISQSAFSDFFLYNRASASVRFGTANTERMRITSNGGIAFGGASNFGTSGQVLTSNGDAAPTWTTISTSAFPAGTRMSFQQTSAPTGWTKDTTAAINDSILRLVTGSVTSGGSTAFSTFNGQTATGATTLATTQIPSHNHLFYQSNTTTGTGAPQGSADGNTLDYSFNTSSTGGGGSHTHSITTAIKYYDFIIASKD